MMRDTVIDNQTTEQPIIMSDPEITIFMSHSHKDKELVEQLHEGWKKYIAKAENQLQIDHGEKFRRADIKFWYSSDPNAMPPGTFWQTEVLEKLSKADILVPIITENAIKSTWVWFEIGYFWSCKSGKDILPLCDGINIPSSSPLSPILCKRIDDPEELAVWGHNIALRSYKIAGLFESDN